MSMVRKWLRGSQGDKTEQDDRDMVPLEMRWYNVYAAVSFIVIMVVVGLPQWWITTRVYRATLPYAEIAKLQDTILVLPVSVSLVTGDETVGRILNDNKVLADVESRVTEEMHRMKVSLELTQRPSSDAEKSILSAEFNAVKELESALYIASVASRGKKIHSQDVRGDGIEIFILHRPGQNRVRTHFGFSSRIFIIGDFVGEFRKRLSEILAGVILQGYLRIDDLLETVARHTKGELGSASDLSKANLSTGVLNPKMTLELHVVDPEPLRCPERFPVNRIVDDTVVKDFLAAFRDVTDISVKSQMLYNIEFRQNPIQNGDIPPIWYLDPNSLQHLINPIETYLGTDVTTEPVYHMLLYVAPPSVSPLFVPSPDRSAKAGHLSISSMDLGREPPPRIDSSLVSAPYNSFVVSGWGSVTVVNANRTCLGGEKLIIDPASVKATKMALIANLRKFFGLQLPKEFECAPAAALADWEVQSLRYRALVEYIFSSIRTLGSLTKLLEEITTIVINDEIAKSIALAVSEIDNVLNSTSVGVGGHWRMYSMLKSATRAFEESEKAFFDPTLLALLYFPSDQKYAIYIPLFLPIGVPVLGSIMFVWKHFKTLVARKKEKEL